MTDKCESCGKTGDFRRTEDEVPLCDPCGIECLNDDIEALRALNKRLVEMLERHGKDYESCCTECGQLWLDHDPDCELARLLEDCK
jgi:hypothetical protein